MKKNAAEKRPNADVARRARDPDRDDRVSETANVATVKAIAIRIRTIPIWV